MAAKPHSVLEPHAAFVPIMPRWEGKVKNATLSLTLMGDRRGCCFSQGLASDFSFTCWVTSLCCRLMYVQDRTPTCRALQWSEEDRPQDYPKGPGTRETLTVAVSSTLPVVHILITSASGSTAFQESACPFPLQSGARLVLFLSSTPAIFRPGDCLFPARVWSSRQCEVLIDGCRGCRQALTFL